MKFCHHSFFLLLHWDKILTKTNILISKWIPRELSKNSQRNPKEFLKKIHKKSQKIPQISKNFLRFWNAQLPTMHLEAKNPLGLVSWVLALCMVSIQEWIMIASMWYIITMYILYFQNEKLTWHLAGQDIEQMHHSALQCAGRCRIFRKAKTTSRSKIANWKIYPHMCYFVSKLSSSSSTQT